jgi:hypothetical protein
VYRFQGVEFVKPPRALGAQSTDRRHPGRLDPLFSAARASGATMPADPATLVEIVVLGEQQCVELDPWRTTARNRAGTCLRVEDCIICFEKFLADA